MPRRLARALMPLALAMLEVSAQAQPPRSTDVWHDGPPLGKDVQSLKVLRSDVAIYSAPSKSAQRRGAAQRLARLPIYAHRSGEGCDAQWYLVGPSAWVCGEHAAPDPLPPVANVAPRVFPDGLALSYHFVKELGALGYSKLSHLDAGMEDTRLEEGFAVALIQQARARSGLMVGLTTHDIWVQMEDLRPASPAHFTGVELEDPENAGSVGWLHEENVRVYAKPGKRRTRRRLRRLTEIRVLERQTRGDAEWLRIGDEQWIRASDARVRTNAVPPTDLLPHERWLDVELAQQIVTAFEGTKPVFATLTSTGKGKEGTEQATPPGEYRIWVKLAASDMDNLEDPKASRYYAMQAVPWVMFFHNGYGLHGVYWHSSFGNVRSQGCVNLAPKDAQRLFRWAHPRLPAGWSAILPTQYDPGTRVVVR